MVLVRGRDIDPWNDINDRAQFVARQRTNGCYRDIGREQNPTRDLLNAQHRI